MAKIIIDTIRIFTVWNTLEGKELKSSQQLIYYKTHVCNNKIVDS